MSRMKSSIGTLSLLAAAMFAAPSQAQTLQVLTAGSSAQFGPFAVAAYELATQGGVPASHYTVKTSGACTDSSGNPTNCAALVDTSAAGIPNEGGNLWVVWSSNGIWAYLSVDSTVGVRTFMNGATVQLAANLPLSSTTNFTYWADGSNDTAMPAAVYNAINGHTLTAANTDIRPEDALFATNNAINLGYSTSNRITSTFTSSSKATPVNFSLSSRSFATYPIGAAPIIFIANNGGPLASATDISTSSAQALFGGTECDASLLGGSSSSPISAVLREPLSGTMNTTEFTVFNLVGSGTGQSQETGVTTNPLNQNCASGGGSRFRGVGTGDVVNAVSNAANTNFIGYAFFSYESTGHKATYKYVTLDGVDPISTSYSNGDLPTCPVSGGSFSCPVPNGTSFPHLRDGSYKAWSIYRLIADPSDTNAQTLVAQAQASVNGSVPDFVPFSPVCDPAGVSDDTGLPVYRQHFTQVGVAPNDGPNQGTVVCAVSGGSYPYLALGGLDPSGANNEAGGDVGGAIVGPNTSAPVAPGPVGTRM